MPCRPRNFFVYLDFFRHGLINAKDVMIITGRKPRAAWKLLAKNKKRYKKGKDQFVTIKEFSAFTGIEEESIFASNN